MLKIKLARVGKNKQPHYRFVINEARDKRDGQAVEIIGHYAPAEKPKILEVNLLKYDAWLAKGAQPTETVRSLITRLKSGNPFPPKKAKLSKKAIAKRDAPKEEKAAPVAAQTETVEAPAVEAAAAETEVATSAPESATAPEETASPETTAA